MKCHLGETHAERILEHYGSDLAAISVGISVNIIRQLSWAL